MQERWLRSRGDDPVTSAVEGETQQTDGAPVRAGDGDGSTPAEAAARAGDDGGPTPAEAATQDGGAEDNSPCFACRCGRRPSGTGMPHESSLVYILLMSALRGLIDCD